MSFGFSHAAAEPRRHDGERDPQVRPSVDERLVVLHRQPSPAIEQYNALRYALERWADGGARRVVAVTSPAVAEGKSTTAINLAGAVAHRAGARALLVDADLRRPSVAALLGMGAHAGSAGLAEALADPRHTLDSVVTSLPAFNLDVLLAGRPSDNPYELLRAPRLTRLLEDARRKYDFVVVDTSPFLLVPDARSLEHLVDGLLLVVAAHRTPRKLVEETLNLLDHAKLIGLVFNGDDRPLSRYYRYYDYYDAYGSTASQREAP